MGDGAKRATAKKTNHLLGSVTGTVREGRKEGRRREGRKD